MTTTKICVFVSGASGFIAQHTVKLLLEKGYAVVGSVRSKAKGKRLTGLFKSTDFRYCVVPDIEPAGAFDEAVKSHPEVTAFLHTASPFHYNATDVEQELLLPAVNGTRNALCAIKKYGPQIEHVVITSSYVAMWDIDKFYDPTHREDEELWSPITWEEARVDAQQAYYGSKKFAEKAVWEFIETQSPKFTVNFVNPVLVFGPQAFDAEVTPELNTSSEIVNGLLKLDAESQVPEIASVFVDVRDVARAHLVAFESKMPNVRLLLYASKFTAQGIMDIIKQTADLLMESLPMGNPGSGPCAEAKICHIDNSKTRALLGFKLINLRTSVVDTVAQIVRARNALGST
ncbi:NAD(P)-binding protein [Metschnikowia bicuspidata var. bicuspidata NRRL YB-4993]|uniref:NAD(P)-binding protein n=1 Tax=Metschnikowia bicuspidata var. bicuspidata NRRL YB-4993 TaxID=869754 RepID=A0A1A0HET0_9ASCO|nr:NAD(P)-binding protein [Metschnikowia bicuspidata var. bicuspidata NRRL YB-4993]OBA22480.1 NAD(P)-binding protein [Metschnikowia bicuspidata var. bicuspidata NRRL YB-4993]